MLKDFLKRFALLSLLFLCRFSPHPFRTLRLRLSKKPSSNLIITHHRSCSFTTPRKHHTMALRRHPTRIELQSSDIAEYNEVSGASIYFGAHSSHGQGGWLAVAGCSLTVARPAGHSARPRAQFFGVEKRRPINKLDGILHRS